jgi:hypothetical protein
MFFAFYAVELTTKLAVYQVWFFLCEDCWWNFLDAFLVLLSIYDYIMSFAVVQDDGGMNVAMFRVLRLLRVSRIFRAFQVMRFFKELRVMLKCITSSIRSLFWCTFMLALFHFVFAVVFLNGTVGVLKDPNASMKAQEVAEEHFGSLGSAMISLYEATTGGRDWGELGPAVTAMGDLYYWIFIFYITFILLAVLNILTGIFVENAIAVSQKDFEGHIAEKVQREQEIADVFERLFRAIDHNQDDELPYEEFTMHMNLPSFWAYLEVLGLDIVDPKGFYDMVCDIGTTKASAMEPCTDESFEPPPPAAIPSSNPLPK